MSTSPDILEGLLRPPSGDDAIDRKALAGLLVEIAQNLKPELRAQQNGVRPGDLQLEQLRTLLVGREIETLSRLAGVVDDPERLAAVIGHVLPTAIAQATSDTRMGHVLAPVMEKAAESSIRNDPTTLVNILYPTIVPAIRKSIGETIDETFQRLNQTLKYSLTWRGLKWRWEAWRTGRPFAEVVLRHTLVYQVEHVFLIHRHTGPVDRACGGRECGEPGPAAGLFDAGGDPGFRPRFLQRRRASGGRLGAAGRAAAMVRARTVCLAGRGDPRRSAGGAARCDAQHAVAHPRRAASCARKLRRRQLRLRRRRGALTRTGGAWRA